MKKTILLGIMGLSALTGFSQTKEIPEAVKAKIIQTYPKAEKVKFEKEKGNFEAGFKNEGKEMSVVLDAKGNILETETDINFSGLPKEAKQYIAEHFKGKKIKETAEITDAQGKKKFEVEIGGKDYLFDESGKLLKN